MAKQKADVLGFRKAIEQFGSLGKAIEGLQRNKAVLEKQLNQLKQEVAAYKSARDSISSEIEGMKVILSAQKEQRLEFSEQISNHMRQYKLFQGFMAMLTESSFVDSSIGALIASLQKLIEPGWQLSHSRDEMRSLFIRTVFGDYLKCFYCENCGSRFIVNKCQKNQYRLSSYQCPVCHYTYKVKADESFIKALVSEEQLENTYIVEQLIEENAILRPLTVFFTIPCDICSKPITDWNEYNIKAAIAGFGWGHSQCWNTAVGKFKIITKAANDFQATQEEKPQNNQK
ncbi:hypothetical protein ACFLV5_00930 [Chloroflexota bacterium]